MKLRRRAVPTTVTLSASRPSLEPVDDEFADQRRQRVALVTEGTYPGNGGGVSVWCDQLVNGLPSIDFQVVAITLSRREPLRWPLPDNARLANLPIWDRSLEDTESSTGAVVAAVRHLVEVLVSAPAAEPDDDARFAGALAGMIAASREGTLAASIRQPELCAVFTDALQRDPRLRVEHGASLLDISRLAEAFSHLFRPLLMDIGPVDLVHCSAAGLPLLVALSAKYRRGVPFVVTEHGLFLRERYLGVEREVDGPVMKAVILRFYQLLNRLGYAEAALIAPVSEFNRRWQVRMGAPSERIRLIHSAVEPADFPVRLAEPPEPSISWLGRIDPIKDLHTLIRAAAVVRDRRPDAVVRIYGSATPAERGYLASCHRLVDELDLQGVVRFEGRVPHAMDAFHASQISALSSISEGFPYTVLESMACGVPVVGTDVGGVTEAIGQAGRSVPARDPEAMGNACLELLDSATLRRSMGLEGRQRVERMFSLDQMLTTHDEVYASLAAWGRTRAQRSGLSVVHAPAAVAGGRA